MFTLGVHTIPHFLLVPPAAEVGEEVGASTKPSFHFLRISVRREQRWGEIWACQAHLSIPKQKKKSYFVYMSLASYSFYSHLIKVLYGFKDAEGLKSCQSPGRYALTPKLTRPLIYVNYFKSPLVCWGPPGSPTDQYSDLQLFNYFSGIGSFF